MAEVIGVVRGWGRALLSPPSRSEQDEILDGDTQDADELAQNFRDIQRVNQLLGGTSTVLRHLLALLASVPEDRPATILDLATGSGDIPLAIARWAERRDRAVTIVATDFSEDILALARKQLAGLPNVTVERYDARDVPRPDGQFDVVLCSLSLHHFAPDDAIQVLREMDRLATGGFILNDLRRGRLGYVAAWVAARLTTRNRLTRNDAPLSVRRAYTVDELADLLQRAGVENAKITTHRWFRMAAVRRGARRHDA